MYNIKFSSFWFVSGIGVEGVVKVKRREVEFGRPFSNYVTSA